MSRTHLKPLVLDMKEKLKKALQDVPGQSEQLLDVLSALGEVQMDLALLSSTGIGNTLKDVKKACKDREPILSKVNKIMSSWRELVNNNSSAASSAAASATSAAAPLTTASSSSANASDTTAAAAVVSSSGSGNSSKSSKLLPVAEFKSLSPAPAVKSSSLASSSSSSSLISKSPQTTINNYPENEARKRGLPSDRRMAVGIVFKQFQKYVNEGKAEHLALNLEAAINKAFDISANKAKYSEKLKSITFNLTKNEPLRNVVLKEQISLDTLAKMSPADLASNDIKEFREKIVYEEVSARRLDQQELYRKEIQSELGIDMANSWQYDQDDDAKSEADVEAPDS